MKNIHILPTDKPSRLISSGKEFNLLEVETTDKRCKNIYITNDEKIKDGDWFYDLDTKYVKVKQSWEKSHLGFNGKKIILTTDQDLITDSIQNIDDEFLNWFVKNLSCEKVEIRKEMYTPQSNGKISDGKITHEISLNPLDNTLTHHKIIIPNKEKCICENPTDNTCNYCNELERKQILLKAELNAKQETVKEGALRIIPDKSSFGATERSGFIKGAKWQQKQGLSEPESLNLLILFAEWFNNNEIISPQSYILKDDIQIFVSHQFKK